jgi:hypothetical protein
MTATSGHLEASALRLVSGAGKTARGKIVMDSRGAREGGEVGRAPPSRSRKVASSSVVSKEEPAQRRATTTRCGMCNSRIQAVEGRIKAVRCPWSWRRSARPGRCRKGSTRKEGAQEREGAGPKVHQR